MWFGTSVSAQGGAQGGEPSLSGHALLIPLPACVTAGRRAGGADGDGGPRRLAARPALGAVFAALLAGCASVGDRSPAPAGSLAGRLAVQVAASAAAPARSLGAGFELSGDERAGRLDLATPLGTVLAQARWAPGRVVLVTPQATTDYPDLQALTRDLLGESLPVGALFDWLRGRPWPGAASTLLDGDDGPGFVQLGWKVRLDRFADGRVAARRAGPPAVVVQVVLDRP